MHDPSQISYPFFFPFLIFFFSDRFFRATLASSHVIFRSLIVDIWKQVVFPQSFIRLKFKYRNKGSPHRTYSDILHDCWCFVYSFLF